jgi:CheY-like chemotaxis protein
MARNPQILIVDQDIQARAELQKMLALSRFAVVGEAGYGVEAVSLVQELVPDLIMVRVEEPVARPLQTVEAIASSAPDLPIVVYSSINDAGAVRRAMLAGVQDYLNLPLKQEEVAKTINDLIAKQENRRQRTGAAPGMSVAPEPADIQGTIITVFGAKGGAGSVNWSAAANRSTVTCSGGRWSSTSPGSTSCPRRVTRASGSPWVRGTSRQSSARWRTRSTTSSSTRRGPSTTWSKKRCAWRRSCCS